MLRRILFLSVAALTIAVATPVPRAQVPDWISPIGIPAPPFGIRETAPPDPNPWTTPVTGFYYVDATSSASTDTNNPLGTPGNPRKTIPLTLPAGAVVEVRGTYTTRHMSPATLTLNGTATSPVFIRGKSATERTAATAAWEPHGSYFIIENFDFAVGEQFLMVAPILRGVLRNSTLRGTPTSGGVAVGGAATSVATDVVLFRNVIHDNGDVAATYDQDVHGVVVAPYTTNLWVLENELYRNSGDGIQINAGSAALQPTVNHIYVGRNYSHNNKQTGMWTKQAVDVIISENVSAGHRPSNSSGGAGMGFQYAPERIWFINNHIHDCEMGIGTGSDNDLGTGKNAFFIGNVIHNIHSASFKSGTGWAQAAISLPGGTFRYVLNNTIYDVDGGIYSPSGAGAFVIVNNIVADVTNPQGGHVFLEANPAPSASQFHNNLLGGTVRIFWGGYTPYNLSSFQSAFPGKGLDSINADPMLVNPAGESFGLQAGSPAIDKGSTENVYDGFKSVYGLDLAVDMARTSRPQGAAWDIGAYEGASTGLRAPTNLRIIR